MSACIVLSLQVMARKERRDASALMLFRKKADVAPVDPLFFPAPPANTSNEVRPASMTVHQHEQLARVTSAEDSLWWTYAGDGF